MLLLLVNCHFSKIFFALISVIEITTLQKVLKKFPTKIVKASEGENSHVHRLVGQPGTDFILPVPSGITVWTETGTKLGILSDIQ